MKAPPKTHPRLWVLLARDSSVGVIFRRGPSKQVRLIKWNTKNDTLELGQWLKGRIYERRCDLSPDGELLIYFASKQETPMGTWTAVSKPPYLTALALWPKGDCWNGGGWFVRNRVIRLNHNVETKLHENFKLGPIKIAGYAESGGEDDTVWDITRARDGWTCIQSGRETYLAPGWRYVPPQLWRKAGGPKSHFIIEMALVGMSGPALPWYQIEYRVLHGSEIVLELGRLDWADWDHRGNLVFAKEGCLFRQSIEKKGGSAAMKIADFNDMTFQGIVAPPWAQRWR